MKDIILVDWSKGFSIGFFCNEFLFLGDWYEFVFKKICYIELVF